MKDFQLIFAQCAPENFNQKEFTSSIGNFFSDRIWQIISVPIEQEEYLLASMYKSLAYQSMIYVCIGVTEHACMRTYAVDMYWEGVRCGHDICRLLSV